MAIASAINRWNYWKNMFGKKADSILDNQEIKGLIGELLVLKELLVPEYGIDKAVSCWMGPLLGHKDFEIDNTWYEVKSVTENAIQVTINSLEQLESDVCGHLIVSRLEETNTVNDNSINLNKVVIAIDNIITSPTILELFHNKLGNYGYCFDEEYDKHNYMYYGTTMYLVSDVFPRLLRSNIPESIGNVKYTIILNSISQFVEKRGLS